ncbi:MAG: sulfatase-like hydrolase/transferase [Kofleriaceae bacterium]
MSSPAGGPRRTRPLAAWLAPSIVAALVATVAAGLIDGLAHVDQPADVAVTAGFAVVLAAPVAAVVAVVTRAALAAWRPRARVAALTDADGAAPRLAGWVVAMAAALALVVLSTNQAVRLLARATAWRPRTVSVVLPGLVLVAALGILFITPALAHLGARGFARLERRRRRRGLTPRLTPRRIVGATAAAGCALVGLAWWLAVRPLTRQLDLDGLGFVAATVVGLVVIHLTWRWLPRRRALAAAAVAAATLLAGAAGWARRYDPTRLLGLWGGDGFGALAIDALVDVRAVRSTVPAAALRVPRRPGAPQRDIILLTIDTFRPDRLAAYGGPVATPALTELAAHGAVFDLALAPSNVTRRSLPSLVTGVATPRLRGRVTGWALRMDPRHVTVAERLRAGGYDTIGLFCCEGFWSRSRPTGLEAGFSDLVIEHDADKLVAALAARLAARPPDAAPLYAWLHFIELHEWAGGDPDMSPDKRRRYDEALTRIDGSVAALAAAVAALPPARQPIVIITGDHSEALGDHGQPFHATDLYNSQLRVPLIITGPGVAARRVAEPVSLLDVVPTTLALAGFEPLRHPLADGRSLEDLVLGTRAPDPDGGGAYAAMVTDRFVRTTRRALVRGRWKLIHTDGSAADELYDLRADPRELTNRAVVEPARLRAMQAELATQRVLDRMSPFWR